MSCFRRDKKGVTSLDKIITKIKETKDFEL